VTCCLHLKDLSLVGPENVFIRRWRPQFLTLENNAFFFCYISSIETYLLALRSRGCTCSMMGIHDVRKVNLGAMEDPANKVESPVATSCATIDEGYNLYCYRILFKNMPLPTGRSWRLHQRQGVYGLAVLDCKICRWPNMWFVWFGKYCSMYDWIANNMYLFVYNYLICDLTLKKTRIGKHNCKFLRNSTCPCKPCSCLHQPCGKLLGFSQLWPVKAANKKIILVYLIDWVAIIPVHLFQEARTM